MHDTLLEEAQKLALDRWNSTREIDRHQKNIDSIDDKLKKIAVMTETLQKQQQLAEQQQAQYEAEIREQEEQASDTED